MKKITFLLLAVLSFSAFAADYKTLNREITAAKKAGADKDLIIRKYQELYDAAATSKERCYASLQLVSFYESLKQKTKASKVMEAELKKDNYDPADRQSLIIRYAATNLWNPKYAKKINTLLKEAYQLKGLEENDSNHFRLLNYIGCNFCRFSKEYQQAVDIILPAIPKFTHPHHISELYYRVGFAYEKMNKNDEAVKYYQLSVEFGKKAKKSTAETEKRIKKLTK